MDAVAERTISGEGTAASEWTAWLASRAIRTASMDDLCPEGSRLVVVAPHPDDEVLACGGLLALRTRAGLTCLVVAVTDGEASHGSDPGQAAAARLAARRCEESHTGLAALGIASSCVVRLGLPDGHVACFEDALAGRLAGLLCPSDVMVATWQRDGHPDHESTARACLRAARLARCRLLQAPVWMWHWARPGDPQIPWDCLSSLDLPPLAMRAKLTALHKHCSQLEPRSPGVGPVLTGSILDRAAWSREYYFDEAALP